MKEIAVARQFIAKSLGPESVDKAFAVVRSADFTLTLDQWRDYALGLIKRAVPTSGVLSIENRAGTIQGLCGYRTESSLGHSAICSVDYLVALDLVDEAPVLAALLKALENMARRQGATALRLDLPDGARTTEQLLQRLCESGHRIEWIRLLKELRTGGLAKQA
jgi:hypothetical protein